ncbi:MAG: hypothetical protein AAFY21_03095 [Cyanobacteria bacterium J06641_2]
MVRCLGAGLKQKLGFIDDEHILLTKILPRTIFVPQTVNVYNTVFSQADFFMQNFALNGAKTLIQKIINSALYFLQNKFDSMLFYYEDLNTISYNITLSLAQLVQHRHL